MTAAATPWTTTDELDREIEGAYRVWLVSVHLDHNPFREAAFAAGFAYGGKHALRVSAQLASLTLLLRQVLEALDRAEGRYVLTDEGREALYAEDLLR